MKEFFYERIFTCTPNNIFQNILQDIIKEKKYTKFLLILMNSLVYDWSTEMLITCWDNDNVNKDNNLSTITTFLVCTFR